LWVIKLNNILHYEFQRRSNDFSLYVAILLLRWNAYTFIYTQKLFLTYDIHHCLLIVLGYLILFLIFKPSSLNVSLYIEICLHLNQGLDGITRFYPYTHRSKNFLHQTLVNKVHIRLTSGARICRLGTLYTQ